MAHQYYGNDGLILTSITKENFDSGLSRVDCIYKCMTTSADALEPTLVAGFRIPDRTNYIIRENAKRKDDTDGFTTFTVSGFYGTLQTSSNGTSTIPSVLGIATSSINLQTITVIGLSPTTGNIYQTNNYPLNILSDTITTKFTVAITDSCLNLTPPAQKLNAKIQDNISNIESVLMQGWSYYEPSINTTYSYRSLYIPGTITKQISSTQVLVNVNRTNFGAYDEITATWGLSIKDIYISPTYTQSRVMTSL